MSPVPAGGTLTHVSGAAESKGRGDRPTETGPVYPGDSIVGPALLPSSRSQPGPRDRRRFRFRRMPLTQD